MEREAGFLTKGYREFLESNDREAKVDPDNSTTRSRIKSKTKGAIYDFSLLLEHLPHEERKAIFEGEDVGHPHRPGRKISDGDFAPGLLTGWYGADFEFIKGDANLVNSIADTIAFLWLACYDAQVEPEEVMEAGIERAMDDINRPRRSADVTMKTDVHRDQRQRKAIRGRKKMANGAELADAEVRALLSCEEESVPDALVFDYLRGDIDSYELHPLPFEETNEQKSDIRVESGISDEELEEALDDEFTVKDGTIIYGEPPPEIDEETRDAVIDALGYQDFVEMAVEGLKSNNENIDAPVPVATFLDWLHTLHEVDLEPLADEAGVSVATFRRVLSHDDHEIKSRLASKYDGIKPDVPDPAGRFDDTDGE